MGSCIIGQLGRRASIPFAHLSPNLTHQSNCFHRCPVLPSLIYSVLKISSMTFSLHAWCRRLVSSLLFLVYHFNKHLQDILFGTTSLGIVWNHVSFICNLQIPQHSAVPMVVDGNLGLISFDTPGFFQQMPCQKQVSVPRGTDTRGQSVSVALQCHKLP